ncbi:MAG: aspartyl/asparaginyl beta-hydroxylase domain-containing protein [Sphingomicrobium sp.]
MSSAPAPANVVGLLAQGDGYAAKGDSRAATSYYQAALQAAQQGAAIDLTTRSRLNAAVGYIRQAAEAYTAALKSLVADRPASARTDRLRHAVEILAGERELFLQEPTVFYFPYLANRQFFERDEFDWVAELEAETPAIRAELEAIIAAGADFQPYVEDEPDRPRREFHGLHGHPSWTALYLWRDGRRVEENAARCPRTMAALDKVPMTRIGAKTPSVLFSRLTPGAHIPPHRGMLNGRLIAHLPLIVPDGCWLRVGNETRTWEEGKLLIFDDSFEHEARNDSNETRIVLLFDLWRPELNDDEKAGISRIFDTIDRFTGVPSEA